VGDPLRLRQILVSLLGNAIKFTELGEVVVVIENDAEAKEPGGLQFTVSDTGIGIPKDKIEAIFSNFVQVDTSTTRKYGGTGLGLAIVYRLVGLMGGRIWVESQPREGSKFIFTAKFGLASRTITATHQGLPDLAGIRVLVVDDNATNREIVREMVVSVGAKVVEADSGTAALVAVRQAIESGQPFKLILLDMRMPEMDGLEVATRIRREIRRDAPLILMLSSDDLKPQLSRLREAELNAYLVKPITRRELFQAISKVLDEDKSTHVVKAVEVTSPMAEQPADLIAARILVAEDAPDNRLLISAYLRRTKCRIDFAENGQIAVEKLLTTVMTWSSWICRCR
jgi:two-component system sensor histidine kinase/response regulator